MNLRKGLELLLEKINTNKITIKQADKGFITVVMTPKDYWNMCYRHLSDAIFYNNLDNNDPSTIVQERVNKFDEKYKSILTNNEYDFLTKRCHQISNFYMHFYMDYWNMCYRHLSDAIFYNNLDNNDPSTIFQDRVNKFDEKYKSILTNNEYDFLNKRCHQISNFYMLPKLYKSKKINEIIEIKRTECIQIDEDISVKGRPIVAGPVFHTSGISEFLHCIMEPALSLIPHIVKGSFDFTQRLEK